jgi:ferric-dicitrate binding protein FerR (iron transport regulator)
MQITPQVDAFVSILMTAVKRDSVMTVQDVHRTPDITPRTTVPHQQVLTPVRKRGIGVLLNGIHAPTNWAAVAAMLSVLVAFLVLAGTGLHAHWMHASTHGPEAIYETHNGQRAEVMLADGTKVFLNVASRLEVPEQFSTGDHVVHLIGEADFQVAHHTGTPLVVEAGATHTRVLGTEFSVRAYRPENVRVAVRSGKVAVNDTVLNARDVAHVTQAGHLTVAHDQRVESLFGFMFGRLSFVNTPLRTAIPDLNRWYDVDIQLGNQSLGVLPLDAALTSGSIGDLIEILRVTFAVRVVRIGRTLTLYPR